MTAGPSDLEGVVSDALTTFFGRTCVVSTLRREPYAFSTSYALSVLEVELADGTGVTMILKDLSDSGMLRDARASKPAFLYEPLREIETYRSILGRAKLGTATCYGAVTDQANGSYWLLLERVAGRELWQVGELEAWQDAARWLARLHGGVEVTTAAQVNPHLLEYDAAFYRRWWERARCFSAEADSRDAVAVVSAGLETALEGLAQMPRCFVHGEFYPSNVIVGEPGGVRRICPVDWEMAGIGSGLLDLAALIAGWEDEQRLSLARSYLAALTMDRRWPPEEGEFLRLLRCCELYLAVQWVGWSQRWTAPPEHARDWLGEAVKLSEELLA